MVEMKYLTMKYYYMLSMKLRLNKLWNVQDD